MTDLIKESKSTALDDLKKLREDYKYKLGNPNYISKLFDQAYYNLLAQSHSGMTVLKINGINTEFTIAQHFFNDKDDEGKANKVCAEFRAGLYAISMIEDVGNNFSIDDIVKNSIIIISKNGSLVLEKKWPKNYINLGVFGENRHPFSNESASSNSNFLKPPTGEIIYEGNLSGITQEALDILELMATYSGIIFDSFINPKNLEKLVSKMNDPLLEISDRSNQLIGNEKKR